MVSVIPGSMGHPCPRIILIRRLFLTECLCMEWGLGVVGLDLDVEEVLEEVEVVGVGFFKDKGEDCYENMFDCDRR